MSRRLSPTPLPELAAAAPQPAEVTSIGLARIEPFSRPPWAPRRLIAALTIPALLVIGAAPAIWEHSAAARRETQRQVTAPPVRFAQRPVRETEAQRPVREIEARQPVRETDVIIPTPSARAKPGGTTGVVIRNAAYRPGQPTIAKSERPLPAKATKGPKGRRAASGNKGPRKWGIWVLNKVGVKILSTEQ